MPQPQVRGTERSSAGLIRNLRELPSREALALRAQAASQVRTPKMSLGLFHKETKVQEEHPDLSEAIRGRQPGASTENGVGLIFR